MNMFLLAAVVAASSSFIVEGVNQTCGETYNPRANLTNFNPSMIWGQWYGTNQTEQYNVTDCYNVQFTRGSDDTKVDIVGWYFVKPFRNVTFSIPGVMETQNLTGCKDDHPSSDVVTLEGTGTVTPLEILGKTLPVKIISSPFLLKFQVFQLEACGFVNIRFCYAIPNFFVTDDYVIAVHDLQNGTAWSKAFDLMANNTNKEMRSINNTDCKF